jgi:hypothetical protein
MQMRFYSGVNEHGQVSHHDLALAQIPDGAALKPEPWGMGPRTIGVNHVAICYPTRDAWLKQVAFLKSQGVPIHSGIDHGMTHSIYISDPNGHGIEILYELPREIWENDIEAPRTTPSASHRMTTPPWWTAPNTRGSAPRPRRSARPGGGSAGEEGPWRARAGPAPSVRSPPRAPSGS